jgi:hypothetical protein
MNEKEQIHLHLCQECFNHNKYRLIRIIEQAEKAERLEQEFQVYKEKAIRMYKQKCHEKNILSQQLQQAQQRIRYLEDELRNCGYSNTDLDNDFLWEFQDKQVLEVDN